jgi:hypothetical protein
MLEPATEHQLAIRPRVSNGFSTEGLSLEFSNRGFTLKQEFKMSWRLRRLRDASIKAGDKRYET